MVPIILRCNCGQTIKAPDEAVGRMVRCPVCKNSLQVPGLVEVELVEPNPMSEIGYVLNLGSLKTSGGDELSFSFHVEADGIAFLQIQAMSDLEDDGSCVMFRLDDRNFENLRKIMARVEDTVRRYRGSGPSRRMIEIWR